MKFLLHFSEKLSAFFEISSFYSSFFFSFSTLSRLLHLIFQQLICALVMRMFVFLVVNDSKNFVCGENCGAFVAVGERALPEDSIGSVLHSIVDETVLSENIQLQATVALFSRYSS